MENDHNCGDLTPFITDSLLLVKDAVVSTYDILSRKMEEFRTYTPIIKKISPSSDDTTCRIIYILLQATIYSDLGATIEEIQNALGIKSRKTIQSRISAMSKEIVLIDDSMKPYRHKLNIDSLKKLL